MLVKSMHQIAQIEFRQNFPRQGGSAPLQPRQTPSTPVFVTNFTAPRGKAILDPPVVQGPL